MKQALKSGFLIPVLLLVFMGATGQISPAQPIYAKLYVLIADPDDRPIEKAEVTVRGESNRILMKMLTDGNGMAEALLPAGHTYILDVGQIPNADRVEIPHEKGFEMELKLIVDRRFVTGTPMAEVVFIVNNHEGKPLSGDFKVVSLSGQKVWELSTDKEGTALVFLPAGESYRVDFPGASNYFRFQLPQEINHRQTLNIAFSGSGPGILNPTIDRILVKFHYVDFDDRGVPGETIQIRGEDRGGQYTVVTNDSGWVSLLLPKGERYVFSTPLLKDFQRIAAPQDEQLMERTILINYISTKGYYLYMAEIEKEERRRDSIYHAKIKELQDTLDMTKGDYRYNYSTDKVTLVKLRPVSKMMATEDRKNMLVERAKEEEMEADKDFTYFIKQRQAVNAPFFRFREKWKNNVVVVDVTCSMDPYVDQLMTWLAMKFSAGQKNRFVFFNDGDGKPVEEKYIGKTGGLHYTDAKDIEKALTILYHAESFGCSGDPPENDLEALLHAVKHMERGSQLILIADNLSGVRDIELLKKLKVPVRVILCGLWDRGFVHPHYLEIAYHTGGSIHTIANDIMDLKKKVDKDRLVEINKRIYHYRYGKFVPEMGL